MQRVIGIDPGSCKTGYGIIECNQFNGAKVLTSGTIVLGSQLMPARLQKLYAEVHELVTYYRPNVLAIEQVFVHKNVRSALKLGQARGVAIAAAMAGSLEVFEYAPRQVKQAIVGRGAAGKSQVQHMIKVLLQLTDLPAEDAADALAVALTHTHTHHHAMHQMSSAKRTQRYREGQWKSYDRSTNR